MGHMARSDVCIDTSRRAGFSPGGHIGFTVEHPILLSVTWLAWLHMMLLVVSKTWNLAFDHAYLMAGSYIEYLTDRLLAIPTGPMAWLMA
jgi:hypothetical protein